MNSKIVAAALVVTFIPGIANAQHGSRYATPQPATHNVSIADRASNFLTWLIAPPDDGRPSVAYADNPELIGNRFGSSDPAWHK